MSNDAGNFCVGSRDGHVKMYTSTDQKRAKTDLAGLGAPVIAIDTTKDGKWVLATTEN